MFFIDSFVSRTFTIVSPSKRDKCYCYEPPSRKVGTHNLIYALPLWFNCVRIARPVVFGSNIETFYAKISQHLHLIPYMYTMLTGLVTQ